MTFSSLSLFVIELRVVHIIPGVFLKRLDIDHHDLNLIAGGELTYLAQLLGIVNEVVEGRIVVQGREMFLRHIDARQHALADRYARYHDDELLEAVLLVQLKDGAEIDIGLAGSGFHLNGEVREVVVAWLAFFHVLLGLIGLQE